MSGRRAAGSHACPEKGELRLTCRASRDFTPEKPPQRRYEKEKRHRIREEARQDQQQGCGKEEQPLEHFRNRWLAAPDRLFHPFPRKKALQTEKQRAEQRRAENQCKGRPDANFSAHFNEKGNFDHRQDDEEEKKSQTHALKPSIRGEGAWGAAVSPLITNSLHKRAPTGLGAPLRSR